MGKSFALLIVRAELLDGRTADVRVANGRIEAIGALPPEPGETVLDASGGLLLPGLHDHHAHIAATAAAVASVSCGPPHIANAAALAAVLARPGKAWLRGTGYHDSVAGPIDRWWLDAVAPDRPVRIQHRSGRMWIFNSAGLDIMLASAPAPDGLERNANGWTGRLFDCDAWLRVALGGSPPDFTQVGAALARFGVTGVTDMTPSNDDAMAGHFAHARKMRALPQRVLLAGAPDLGARGLDPLLMLGPLKLHLHEADLPAFDAVAGQVRTAHARGRAVAVHCVTAVELIFALAVFRDAGAQPGDRIEHASVASRAALHDIAAMGLAIVTQPHFIAERGDAYRAEIASAQWQDLYRLRSVISSGIDLAGGTDMPFGQPDPWAAMAAAVSRRTQAGHVIGQDEALTPEQALRLFTVDPFRLNIERRVQAGAMADLCLLHEPWARARGALGASLVRATLIGGAIVHGPAPARVPEMAD